MRTIKTEKTQIPYIVCVIRLIQYKVCLATIGIAFLCVNFGWRTFYYKEIIMEENKTETNNKNNLQPKIALLLSIGNVVLLAIALLSAVVFLGYFGMQRGTTEILSAIITYTIATTNIVVSVLMIKSNSYVKLNTTVFILALSTLIITSAFVIIFGLKG